MTIVEGVGWVLVHFIWQGVAIALTLAAVARVDARSAGGASLRALLRGIGDDARGDAGHRSQRLSRDVAGRFLATPAPIAAWCRCRLSATENRSLTGTTQATTSGRRDDSRCVRSAGASGSPPRLSPVVEACDAVAGAALGWWASLVLAIRLARRLVADARSSRRTACRQLPAWCRRRNSCSCARGSGSRTPVSLVASVASFGPGRVRPCQTGRGRAGGSVRRPESIASRGDPGARARARPTPRLPRQPRADVSSRPCSSIIPAVWWVSRQVRDRARTLLRRSRGRHLWKPARSYIHALLDLEELRSPSALLALGARRRIADRPRPALVAPIAAAMRCAAARGERDRVVRRVVSLLACRSFRLPASMRRPAPHRLQAPKRRGRQTTRP